MNDKYKIIAVDRDYKKAVGLLEERVNKFISKNPGFLPTSPPVILDNDIVQTLIHVSAVEVE